MKELQQKIISEGKVLPNNIIKVDGFLNHRINNSIMKSIAIEFAKIFDISKIDVIVTAEASGIPVASICGYIWDKPMIFAKKAKSDNIEGGLYKSKVFSYTYKKEVTLLLSEEWLDFSQNVLIIDDFIARGEAIKGLIDIVKQSGANLIGVGIVIEKGFQKGGDYLRSIDVNYHALAVIDRVENGQIIFREDN